MKQVTIYSTPTCPYCKMEKAYLDEKGIHYTNIDVTSDPTKADEMVQKSGQTAVPVTVIANGEEKIIVGFDKSALDQALTPS